MVSGLCVDSGPRPGIEFLWRAFALAVLPLFSVYIGDAHGQQSQTCESLPSWCKLSEDQADFLRRSRHATEIYQSLAAAIADGFRPVGADAPAMGRHWVNIARVFDREIDAEKPEILMYAKVNGRDSLAGLGFGYVVGSDSKAVSPANPFDPHDWHTHSGQIDVESHRTDHVDRGPAGSLSGGHGHDAGAGVSVLHTWVWVENPAGVLSPNNWALPYFRLELPRPANATPEADLALSLVSLGTDFFRTRAELFMEADSGPIVGWPEALRSAKSEADLWWRTRSSGPITQSEVEWLGALWRRFELTGL